LAAGEKLPARLAGLARGFTIVFVGEAVSAAAFATAATSAAGSSAITAAVSSAKIVAGAAWWSAFAAGARFVDLQIASAGFLTIESSDRLGRFVVIGHFDEGESTGPAGFPVHGHVHAGDLAERLKQRSQIALRRLKIHVSDKQALHGSFPSSCESLIARDPEDGILTAGAIA
jgi:hypothetical protein